MASRVIKRPPPFLFRYRPPTEVTLGHFEGLLRENHIWASPPRGFTDSNDCRAHINFDLTRKEALRYWITTFRKLGLQHKAASREANSLIAKGGWENPSNHAKVLEDIQQTLDNTGVICLTHTALDERMWNEYAANHRGICLCFETSETPFSSTLDVNYVAELPTVKINADSGEQIEAFLLTKTSSCSWEREWRFVDYNRGGGYKQISPWALQAIVLGSKVEAPVQEEVVRLVTRWKPHVKLFAVDASRRESPNLRLQPLDGTEISMKAHIIPPIQEYPRNAPANRPKSAQLLECLRLVAPQQCRPSINGRIELLAARLRVVESSKGKRTKGVVADGMAAVQEATNLLREIVDGSGGAIPGYGDVAVHLYQLVHATVIKSEPRL
jgi:hypothetical protein